MASSKTNTSNLPVLHSPYDILLPPGLDVRSVFPDGHVISPRYAGRVAQGGLISLPLHSVCQRHALTLHHVELALYADDMAIIVTSRNLTLFVSYLESYLNDRQRWLSEWRIAINVSKCTAIIFARPGRRFIQPRPVTLLGNQSNGSTPLVNWG